MVTPTARLREHPSKSGGSYHDTIIDEHRQSVVSMVEGIGTGHSEFSHDLDPGDSCSRFTHVFNR
jgi:hypothetical protein